MHLELDLFWAGAAPRDPVDVIRANRGRIRQFHVKDMNVDGSFADPAPGLIDFAPDLRARAGRPASPSTSWSATTPAPPPRAPADALDTARVGFEYLASHPVLREVWPLDEQEPALVAALLLAIAGLRRVAHRVARRRRRARPAPPADSSFQKVTLNDFPGEPMSLAVLPDLRVLHTARTGEVRIHDPRTGLNVLAADVPVYQHDEEGLQGVAIDPDFSRNNWVYLYYSPPLDTPVDDPATPDVNEGDAPTTGTAGRLAPVQGRAAAVPVQAARQHARPEQRAADHRRADRPGHLLPRRRPDRLRQQGQPLPVHR